MSFPLRLATRYLTPLREGGSLPAVVEVEGGDFFAVKFRGAGQGARALLAELLVGRLAHHAGLPVPELALVELDAAFGRTERDPEIQDILRGSRGLNVGLGYLDGAFNYDGLAAADLVTPTLAADLVWFDAFTLNIDRTPRNPNLLVHHDRLWLIDHGAALYVHHNWLAVDAARARGAFPFVKDHVLLPLAGDLRAADARLAPRLTPDVLRAAIDALPAALLMDAPEGQTPPFETAEANRQAYLDLLTTRMEPPRAWVEEAIRAQAALADAPTRPLSYRR